MSYSELTKTRIKMFTDRGIFNNESEVIDAAIDLLMEKQLEDESKSYSNTIPDEIMTLQFECMNRLK